MATTQETQPPEEENENFWSKVKDWHEENVRENEQYKQEHGESTEERMRRTLGGQ